MTKTIETIALEAAREYLKFKLGCRKGLDIYDLDIDEEELAPLVEEIERECADAFTRLLAAYLAENAEPAYWQWRRKKDEWSLGKTFNSEVFATTEDSEVRALYTRPSVRTALDLAVDEIHNQIATCPDVAEYADELEELEAEKALYEKLAARIDAKGEQPCACLP